MQAPSLSPPPLLLAVDALDQAEDGLRVLPFTGSVREILRRSAALRTVLHGIVIQRLPRSITREQHVRLTEDALRIAREVEELLREHVKE